MRVCVLPELRSEDGRKGERGMSELIDRNDLILEIMQKHKDVPFVFRKEKPHPNTYYNEGLIDCAELAQKAPAVSQDTRWISVKDRLPNRDEYVLVWGGEYMFIDCLHNNEWASSWIVEAHITHWMPLPEPPKEEEDEPR